MSKPIRKIDTLLQAPDFIRLFPPPENGTYTYFDGAEQFPFAAQANGHSAQNAWWLAEFSLLVYCDEVEVNQVLIKQFGDQQIIITWLDSSLTTDNQRHSNTQGVVLETPDFFIIAFRGTEFPPPKNLWQSPTKLRNIIEDINIDIAKVAPQAITTGDPLFDAPVHPGFAAALQSVWPTLHSAINKSSTKPIWLTGHSLGAAIATLLAVHLPERVAGLYTYGSPCVGTTAFVNLFNQQGDLAQNTFRYVHGNDAVANALPLLGLDYQHVGQLHQLDSERHHGWLTELVNLSITHTIKLNQLNHAPILYCYECWNAIPG